MSEFPPIDYSDVDPMLQLLKEERLRVLSFAGKFHELAHKKNGEAAGETGDVYVVTDDHDIPLLTEKMRLRPLNSRVAPVSEAFLYIPFDSDFREISEHQMTPKVIFFGMRLGINASQLAIVREQDAWMYGGPQLPDRVEADALHTREPELDVPAMFPEARELATSEQFNLLGQMREMLSDRTRYRLVAQPSVDDA